MKDRSYAIDFLRLVSILGVIVIHTSTSFLDRSTPFTLQFYIVHAVNQLTRFSVPLFFAISGFLLTSRYPNIPSLKKFYNRRFSRIIIPYVFWTLIYFLIIFPNPALSLLSFNFLNNLLTGDASYQLYFIPVIILLYLIFPIIMNYKRLLFSRFFVFSFVAIESIILSATYYTNTNLPLYPPIRNTLLNLLPFFIGCYAALNKDELSEFIKKHSFFLVLISVLSGTAIILESLFLFRETHNADFIRNQWRASVIVYALSIGALGGYYYNRFLHRWNKTIHLLSGLSFGVFFIHVVFLTYIVGLTDIFKFYNIFYQILVYLLVVTLSFITMYFAGKIKFIGKIVGAGL